MSWALWLPGWGAPRADEDVEPNPVNVAKELERCDTPDLLTRMRVTEELRDKVRATDLTAVLKAARDRRPGVRWGAVALFYKFEGRADKVLPVLLERLRDKDDWVRWQATNVAGGFRSHAKQLVPALVKALDDKHWREEGKVSVACAAAGSLGRLGPGARPAIPALLEKTRTGNPTLRQEAFRALGEIGRRDKGSLPKVLPVLRAALAEKKLLDNRASAAFALYLIGKEAKPALPDLLRALRAKDVADPKLAETIRLSVMSAFERIGPSAAAAVPDLIAIVEDRKRGDSERSCAVVTLPVFGEKAKPAMPALSKVATDPTEKSAGLRNQARAALVRIDEAVERAERMRAAEEEEKSSGKKP